MQNKTPKWKKSVNQPQTKNISKDLLFYEWYSHVGTFIEIRCDDGSRALKSHTAQHWLLLDSGRINDIKKKLQVRIKKKEKRKGEGISHLWHCTRLKNVWLLRHDVQRHML